MAVKEYIPRLGDATDQFMGPPDTEADVFDRAAERGMDVEGTIKDYRKAVRQVSSVSVFLGGLNVPCGKGPKLRGRWRMSGGRWRPVDAVARRQAADLGITELAA